MRLGWQYATPQPEPGPPPRRPAPPERASISPGWVAAQRRAEALLSRPLKAGCVFAVAVCLTMTLAGLTGTLAAALAAPAAAAAALGAGLCASGVRHARRTCLANLAAEQRRVDVLAAEAQRQLSARQEEHALQVRAWQAQRLAYERRRHWHPVSVPCGVQRIDLAGGTMPGWSAMLTTAVAPLLGAGGQVTVLDLTGVAVAAGLAGLAADAVVRVLPADLPMLTLGLGLPEQELADVLALAASVTGERGSARELGLDTAILTRIIDVLGAAPAVGQVAAALRAVAQIGDPADDVAAGLLSGQQADRLRALFGKTATDRVVIERAWALEAHIRRLAPLGTAVGARNGTAASAACGTAASAACGTAATARPARGALQVLAVDHAAGPLDGKVLGAYLAVALARELRRAPPAGPLAAVPDWSRTVFVLGAEALRDDVLDGLCEAGESAGTGLVLAFRTLPPHVRQRLGRGHAAVAFMRLGNAEEAKAACEQIGSEHRFVVAQLTETVSRSVTDSVSGSRASTEGATSSVTTGWSVSESAGSSRGRGRHGGVFPLGRVTTSRSGQSSQSTTASGSTSVSAGLTTSTTWGEATSVALAGSESLARVMQRSRELLMEPHELQRLPVTAMVVSYADTSGRHVVLTDVNPALAELSDVTAPALECAAAIAAAGPNLGPPPPRLDWRRHPGWREFR